MSAEPIRTWTIGPDSILGTGPRPVPECKVIELEPVLDLLAEWAYHDGLGAMEHEEATAALLREHGKVA